MNFVYILVDPSIETPFYVGITNNPNQRYEQHLSGQSNAVKTCAHIRSLQSQNITPFMRIIEIVYEDREEAEEREKFWIHDYEAQGFILTNTKHVTSLEQPAKLRGRAKYPFPFPFESEMVVRDVTFESDEEIELDMFQTLYTWGQQHYPHGIPKPRKRRKPGEPRLQPGWRIVHGPVVFGE